MAADKNAGTGVVHMFHSGLWGGWSYQISHQDAATQSLLFSHGGYQEARGSGVSHNHYYIENVFVSPQNSLLLLRLMEQSSQAQA